MRACKAVYLQKGDCRLKMNADKTVMNEEKQTENSPSVGKHGTAKPQTGSSAKSKRVTAVKFQQMGKRM